MPHKLFGVNINRKWYESAFRIIGSVENTRLARITESRAGCPCGRGRAVGPSHHEHTSQTYSDRRRVVAQGGVAGAGTGAHNGP